MDPTFKDLDFMPVEKDADKQFKEQTALDVVSWIKKHMEFLIGIH